MWLTLLGIEIEINERHPEKALAPISVTLSGMETSRLTHTIKPRMTRDADERHISILATIVNLGTDGAETFTLNHSLFV